MFPIKIKNKAEKIVKLCLKKKIKLAFAESCTGGMLSSLITSIPNSSKIFSCSYITYSNFSKVKILGISEKTIKKFGAVSHEVAIEMANNVAFKAKADIGIGITGIAGPGGATKNKKVGEVHIALDTKGATRTLQLKLKGSRNHIRLSSVDSALDLLIEYILKPDVTKDPNWKFVK